MLAYEIVSVSGEKDDTTFPYTLRGLLDALGYAAALSMRAGPQLLMAGDRVIRRFEDGYETLARRPGTSAVLDLYRRCHGPFDGPPSRDKARVESLD